MAFESTDNLFHMLLEKTAANMKEEAVPADQPGGPSITPDAGDLTPPAPTGPSVPGNQGPQGQPPYPEGGNHGGRPPHDGMGVPPMGQGPLYVPYPPYYYPGVSYYDAPIRRRKNTGTRKMQDPEDCETFEEQVQVVADNVRNLTISGRYTQAVKYMNSWYDCVTDEDDKLFPEIKDMLQSVSKNNLVLLIEALIQYMG